MTLGERLTEAMKPHELFHISVAGLQIPISDTIVVMWIIMAFLIISALILVRKFKTIPEGKQNFVEAVVEGINSFTKSVIGHHWRPFAPYMGTVLLFLIIANIISIFNIIPNPEQLYKLTGWGIFEHLPAFELRPPTKDINTTAAMAVMSILLVLFSGIRIKGIKGWLGTFIHPMPAALPFKILDYFVRPLSLCLRLFGNILAAFTIMELLMVAIPLVIPAGFSIYFDLFDGALQAYIFVFLTSLYIAETIE